MKDTIQPQAPITQERYAELLAASAKESNAAAHDAGWHEMNWKAMDAANKNKLCSVEAADTPATIIKTTPRQRQIMRAIESKATSSRAIGVLLGISSSVVAGHANLMERKGLLRIIVAGKPGNKRRFYYLTDAGKVALEKGVKV